MDANKGYFKCSCETMGFISSVSRTPIFFFFSTTVAISSRRLSPLSLAAILVVTNGRLNDKENTFSLTFSTAERPKEVQNTKQNVVKYILMTTAINCF